MCGALGLVDLCVFVSDDASDYFLGLIATIEDLEVDAQIQSEDPADGVIVFFDEVGHEPHTSSEVAVSVNKSDITSIIRVNGMFFSCLMPGRASDFDHRLIVIIKDGKHLAPMSGTIVASLNSKAQRRKVTCIAWAGWFVTVHFEPVDVYTSEWLFHLEHWCFVGRLLAVAG